MRAFHVDQSLEMNDEAEFADVELVDAHVGGRLDLSGSKVTGKLDMSRLRVDQSLEMSDKAELADVALNGAHIGFDLSRLLVKSAQWSDGVTLVLRDAKVGIIPALADAWAPKLDLNGFTYRSVGAVVQFLDWFARLDRYTPQPY